ncbi:MAG: 2,3-bisphosphoglycerate-independent phosphoglycerate mutase [bacterium]
MKLAVLIGGGMADEVLEALENRSPLEAASTPNLDRIAAGGWTGLAQTVPAGLEPSAEVAVATLLGLDVGSGDVARGPLEALGIGLSLDEEQIALRFNLVHLFTDYQHLILADHTAGIGSDEEGRPFIEALEQDLGGEELKFVHVGEYRGVILWKEGSNDLELTPPHRILGAEVGPAMPKGEGGRKLHPIYNDAQMVLGAHPLNDQRRRSGQTLVNSIWAYGAGRRTPSVEPFSGRWGIRGGILTKAAVLKGLAKVAGMDVVQAPAGDPSPVGWADAAVDYLRDGDLVFIHCDAGDRAAHRMDAQGKVEAIERFDSLAGALREGLSSLGDYRLAVLADHRTSPLDGKHASAPVPIAVCGAGVKGDRPKEYDERLLVRGSLRITDGRELLTHLLKNP